MKKLIVALLLVFTLWASSIDAQTLSRSGRWLYYDNSPIYLVGYDLQQLFNDASYTEDQVKVYIDHLAAYGVTAFRVWLNTWFMTLTGAEPTHWYPYSYNGTTKKWTLSTTSYNESFFTRWKNLINYAKGKGIIVEIVIFSDAPCVGTASCGTNFTHWTTYRHYYQAANNNLGVWSNVAGDLWPEFFTLNHTESGYNLTTYQKALIDKAVTEFKGIGNVFFQVQNEFPWAGPGATSTGAYVDLVYDWQQYMADYLHNDKGAITSVHAHEYAGLQIQGIEYWNTRNSVDVMAFHPGSTYTSNANIDEIGNLLSSEQNRGKVLMIDEGLRTDSTDTYFYGAVREMWAAFTNGIYYLAYQDDPFVTGSATWLTRAKAIQNLTNIAKTISWQSMTRNPALVTEGPADNWQGISSSTQYCYFFSGTSTTTSANFSSLPTGTYSYIWYPTTATWSAAGIASGTVSGGANVKVPAPSRSLWSGTTGVVLVLKKTDTPTAATNYYVRKGGNDTCNGTVDQDGSAGDCAKLTIQAAVDLATTPGSTVTVHQGDYAGVAPNWETVASGTAENYITIRGYPGETVSTYRIVIKHSFIKVENFTITAQSSGSATAAIKISNNAGVAANYITISGCRILGISAAGSYGISNADTGTWNSYVTVTNCIFDGRSASGDLGFRIVLYMGGSNNTFSYNTFKAFDSVERIMEFYGNNIWFHHNEVYDIKDTGLAAAHADIFQLVDDAGCVALVENNYFHDMIDTQIGHFSVGSNYTKTYAYTFRNNIFANISNPINIYTPNTKFYNNMFYHCSFWEGDALSYRIYSGNDVRNNAFIGCGENDADNTGFPVKGTSDADTYWGAYNFLSKIDGSPKTGYVLGGNIHSTNINGLPAGKTLGLVAPYTNCLTNTCDFKLIASSVLIDTGETQTTFGTDYLGNARPYGARWDIGPYEYNGAPDVGLPVVTSFTIPEYSKTLQVSISSFTATDNLGVTGYLVTESATTPSPTAVGWNATAPTSYTLTTAGTKTLYAWAKDTTNNISLSLSDTVVVDTTVPVMGVFTIPATSLVQNITFSTGPTATDNVAVTGYLVTESATPPLAADPLWTAAAPTTYNFNTPGSKTLYAWAKDAAGNVSASISAAIVVDYYHPPPPKIAVDSGTTIKPDSGPKMTIY